MDTPVCITVTVSKELKDRILPARVKGMNQLVTHIIETPQIIQKTISLGHQKSGVMAMAMS